MKAPTSQRDSQGRLHGIWETHWLGLFREKRCYRHGQEYGLCEYYWEDGTSRRKKYHLRIK